MFRHSQRLFRTLPNTKNPFTKPLHLRMPFHRNFCEQPGTNYHNIMQSSEKKFPIVSVLVGALIALGFGYYQFALHNPEDKKESPQINQAKADLNNPAGAQVSKELRKEIGAQDQDDINTALRLRETAKTNFAQDKYDEVTDLLELALEVLRGANQGNSIHSADVYFDLGFYSLHNNDISKARDAFNKAFEVYSNNGNDERGFDSLDMLTLTYDKDPAGGEAAFEKIIKNRLEKGGPVDPALANAYIQYGLWQIKNSKDKEGIKLLGKASEVLEKNNGKSKHEDLASVYNNLVNAYREAKAYPEGVHVSKSAIKFLDVNKNPALLNDIANLYSEGNDSQKSVEFYRKYLDALKASGKDGYEKGKIIKNIASEYEKQKADKEALATWKEFSGLFDKADSKEVELMSVYGQLRAFALYNRRGKVSEATKELEDASSKTEKLMGKEHMYSQTMKKALERYKGNHAGNEQAKLDLDSLTLVLIALEDNLQKLIDTGYIIV